MFVGHEFSDQRNNVLDLHLARYHFFIGVDLSKETRDVAQFGEID